VYSKNHAAPFSKVITFHKKEPFDLEAFYSLPQELPYPDIRIGTPAYSTQASAVLPSLMYLFKEFEGGLTEHKKCSCNTRMALCYSALRSPYKTEQSAIWDSAPICL
jgi:hypothetical protein